MVQGNFKLVANRSGILEVVGGCTIAVLVLPVGHVQCLHICALEFQQEGGHSGIDAAGQTENYALAGKILIEIFHQLQILALQTGEGLFRQVVLVNQTKDAFANTDWILFCKGSRSLRKAFFCRCPAR